MQSQCLIDNNENKNLKKKFKSPEFRFINFLYNIDLVWSEFFLIWFLNKILLWFILKLIV